MEGGSGVPPLHCTNKARPDYKPFSNALHFIKKEFLQYEDKKALILLQKCLRQCRKCSNGDFYYYIKKQRISWLHA